MQFEIEANVLTDTFQRNKLFNILHHLKISRASLLIEDDCVEFIDNSSIDNDKFQLFRAGEHPVVYEGQQIKDRCPVCNSLIRPQEDVNEDIEDNIVEDYECKHCGFKGSQWTYKIFVGHTSDIPDQSIESYKKMKTR